MLWSIQDKIDVNGKKADPVYRLIKDEQPKDLPNGLMIPGEKGRITWNYTSKSPFVQSIGSSYALDLLIQIYVERIKYTDCFHTVWNFKLYVLHVIDNSRLYPGKSGSDPFSIAYSILASLKWCFLACQIDLIVIRLISALLCRILGGSQWPCSSSLWT